MHLLSILAIISSPLADPHFLFCLTIIYCTHEHIYYWTAACVDVIKYPPWYETLVFLILNYLTTKRMPFSHAYTITDLSAAVCDVHNVMMRIIWWNISFLWKILLVWINCLVNRLNCTARFGIILVYVGSIFHQNFRLFRFGIVSVPISIFWYSLL